MDKHGVECRGLREAGPGISLYCAAGAGGREALCRRPGENGGDRLGRGRKERQQKRIEQRERERERERESFGYSTWKYLSVVVEQEEGQPEPHPDPLLFPPAAPRVGAVPLRLWGKEPLAKCC